MKIYAPTTAQSKQRTRRSKALWKGHHKSCRTTAAINLPFRWPLFGTSLVQYLHHAPPTSHNFESKLTMGTRFTACVRATACDTELHHIPLPRSTLHRTTNNLLQAVLRRTAASANVSITLQHHSGQECCCARHRGSFIASNRKEDNQKRAKKISKCRPSNYKKSDPGKDIREATRTASARNTALASSRDLVNSLVQLTMMPVAGDGEVAVTAAWRWKRSSHLSYVHLAATVHSRPRT